jgi:hypothetical protein
LKVNIPNIIFNVFLLKLNPSCLVHEGIEPLSI